MIRTTSKTIARLFPIADLSSLPTTNPGSGKPWNNSGFLSVGAAAAPAADSAVVHIAGAETITGPKTFGGNIALAGTAPSISSANPMFLNTVKVSPDGRIRVPPGYAGCYEVTQFSDTITGNRSALLCDLGQGGALYLSGSVRFAPAGTDVGVSSDAFLSRYATGPALQVNAAGGLRVQNLAGTADAPITAGDLTVNALSQYPFTLKNSGSTKLFIDYSGLLGSYGGVSVYGGTLTSQVGATITGGGVASTGGIKIGSHSAGYGGFWAAGLTPSTSNYGLLLGTAETYLSSPVFISLCIGGSNKWTLGSSGHFVPGSNNAYDIGTSINQVRNIYAAASVTIGTMPATGVAGPLNIKSDGAGTGFVIANSATDFTRFISGGTYKGLFGSGAVPMVVASPTVKVLSDAAVEFKDTGDSNYQKLISSNIGIGSAPAGYSGWNGRVLHIYDATTSLPHIHLQSLSFNGLVGHDNGSLYLGTDSPSIKFSIQGSQRRFLIGTSQQFKHQVYDASLAAFQETMREEASPAGALWGVFGHGALQQTGGVLTAGAAYDGTVQGMIQTMWDAMRTYGMLT